MPMDEDRIYFRSNLEEGDVRFGVLHSIHRPAKWMGF